MALGLAERVACLTGGPVERRDVEINGTLSWLAGRLPRLSPPLRTTGEPAPGLVIGAGRRIAPTVAAMRRAGAKTVQILDPKMPARHFDLLVAPEHDGLSAPNAIATLGSVNRVTPGLLEQARALWQAGFAALPRPLIAVLIGGATKRTALDTARVEALADDLRQLARDGAGLVVTASRRTGEDNAALLRQALPQAWFWDGTGDNPYFGMLACADGIVVTDDSVNMASEAAATGKPLAIWPLLQEGGKIARFHEALIARGHAQWFAGVPTASAGPLDETGRAAKAVAAMLS